MLAVAKIAFGMMTTVLSSLRIRVERRLISSIVPLTLPAVQNCPIVTGCWVYSVTAPRMSSRGFCRTSATARPPWPPRAGAGPRPQNRSRSLQSSIRPGPLASLASIYHQVVWERGCSVSTTSPGGLRRGGGTRTMDQLRADVFLDLLEGTGPAPHSGRGSVHLHTDLATLAGLADTLEESPGSTRDRRHRPAGCGTPARFRLALDAPRSFHWATNR